jgi:hypothetical protein
MPQVVRLERGRHRSPEEGACVLEVASMLAGGRFSDHPRSVCPVLAAYMRTLNDRLPDDQRQQLYPLAAELVGTRGWLRERRRRAVRCARWVAEMAPGPTLAPHLPFLFYPLYATRCANLAVERGIGVDLGALLIGAEADRLPPTTAPGPPTMSPAA